MAYFVLNADVNSLTQLVHRAVCLFMSQLSLVLIVPSHGGMARLS